MASHRPKLLTFTLDPSVPDIATGPWGYNVTVWVGKAATDQPPSSGSLVARGPIKIRLPVFPHSVDPCFSFDESSQQLVMTLQDDQHDDEKDATVVLRFGLNVSVIRSARFSKDSDPPECHSVISSGWTLVAGGNGDPSVRTVPRDPKLGDCLRTQENHTSEWRLIRVKTLEPDDRLLQTCGLVRPRSPQCKYVFYANLRCAHSDGSMTLYLDHLEKSYISSLVQGNEFNWNRIRVELPDHLMHSAWLDGKKIDSIVTHDEITRGYRLFLFFTQNKGDGQRLIIYFEVPLRDDGSVDTLSNVVEVTDVRTVELTREARDTVHFDVVELDGRVYVFLAGPYVYKESSKLMAVSSAIEKNGEIGNSWSSAFADEDAPLLESRFFGCVAVPGNFCFTPKA